jgi:hypothetical protein
MNETESQTKSQKSKLKNFGDRLHKFSKEENRKGGKKVTERKKRALAFNAMKTGRYSKRVPHCHTCVFRNRCSAYDPKDPKAACKVIDIPNYFHLMSALTFNTEEAFDDFVSKLVQRMYLKNLTNDDWNKLKDFLLIFLKIKDTKFRKPQDQTVNIQINNFHAEFQIFKDVTIKVLNKHPKIMKEWREALESAKQSD